MGALGDLPSNTELYFPTVAIRALLNVLRDPGLSQHHRMAITAIMFVFRSLVRCLPESTARTPVEP